MFSVSVYAPCHTVWLAILMDLPGKTTEKEQPGTGRNQYDKKNILKGTLSSLPLCYFLFNTLKGGGVVVKSLWPGIRKLAFSFGVASRLFLVFYQARVTVGTQDLPLGICAVLTLSIVI